MDFEDEVSNVSRPSGRHVHYADSSITSTNSNESEFEKYMDEAIDTVDVANNKNEDKIAYLICELNLNDQEVLEKCQEMCNQLTSILKLNKGLLRFKRVKNILQYFIDK